MRLYPNLSNSTSYGRSGGPRNSMSTAVSLFKKGAIDNELKAKYKIYAINADLKNVNITLGGFDSFPKNGKESTKCQIELESLLHPDGSIVLYCEVNLAQCKKNFIEDCVSFNIPQKPVSNMYKQGILTDCVIKVGKKSIKAHRCILANNSEVFKRMFEQKDMLEARNGEINIVDSSPDCVRAMINYFYNGQIYREILANLVFELFAIAHKYEVKSLMDICEQMMSTQIGTKNFMEISNYLNLYELPLVEKAFIKYIAARRMTFLDSNEWINFKKLYMDKANYFLELVLKKEF